MKAKTILIAFISLFFILHSTFAFEGRIKATATQGSQAQELIYTVGTNSLRVEIMAANWPNPIDIFDLKSGALTLLFPHNRSFVRLKPSTESSSASAMPGMPAMPMPPGGMPPGVGPQPQLPTSSGLPNPAASANIGPKNLPGMPAMPTPPQMPTTQMDGGAMPSMPAMPMMPMPGEKNELTATGDTTNILGYACTRYELKQRGETMEIWATDKLLPYQPYMRNQPHHFGPRMIEEQWPELIKTKNLFPLLAILKFENGPERFRFEVKKITPEKIEDKDHSLFQPPTDYQEIQPLPF